MAKGFGFFSRPKGSKGKIQLAPDIKITKTQHDKLLLKIQSCMDASKASRGPSVERFREIDKELAAHIQPNDADKKRIRDNRKGKGPKTVDENIQFAAMQIDEAVTFFLGVFAPESGMYSAMTNRAKQDIANGFSAEMNKAARVFKHYRHLARGLLDMVKYNIGGYLVEWSQVKGAAFTGINNAGEDEVNFDALIAAGNRFEALDQYNTFYDPSIFPVDIPEEGEFVGLVDMKRPFHIKMSQQRGEIHGLERIGENWKVGETTYFEPRPIIQHQFISAGAPPNDWDSVLSQKFGGANLHGHDFESEAVERLRFYIWLSPKEFGLDSAERMQIWRFTVLQNEYIVAAEHMNNMHQMLPVTVGMPVEDGLKMQSRTLGEALIPFQRFASAQLNIHQRSSRKKLYGVTVFDGRVIPALEVGQLEGGTIRANPVGLDSKLRDSVMQFNDAPDTTQVMGDIDSSLNLMQKMLPTTQAQQVASLERATRYQAASLIQASNKRNLKIARLIDDQCLDRGRIMQMRNILQFHPKVVVLSPETGEETEVEPSELRAINLEFTISDGLRGIDKLMITESLQEVINMLLQSPIARDYDMGDLLDHYFDLLGDKLDFNQFKHQHPIDGLEKEMKDVAFQLLQQLQQQQNATQADQTQQNLAQQGQGNQQQLTLGQQSPPRSPT